jgi:hypothetical protein
MGVSNWEANRDFSLSLRFFFRCKPGLMQNSGKNTPTDEQVFHPLGYFYPLEIFCFIHLSV